ncbi:hypothetical protein D3C73_1551870 [compost metagenome]
MSVQRLNQNLLVHELILANAVELIPQTLYGVHVCLVSLVNDLPDLMRISRHSLRSLLRYEAFPSSYAFAQI